MAWTFVFGSLIILYVTRNHAQIPRSKFSCKGRSSGYYADVESGCQVYHMCDGLGRQFSYSCPNATLFQQRMLICDHWYMVNCSKSEGDYSANLLIGQKGKPFVDDSDKNHFRRTPRPDLLSHPSDTEYNIIYRIGRDKVVSNLIGAETDENPDLTTEESTYSVPSHWSTEFSQQQTTARPKAKAIDFNNNNNNNNFDSATKMNEKTYNAIAVNFKSNYKATTPVYPKFVESSSVIPDDLGILPPLPIREDKLNSYESTFKATTPNYPKFVESTSIAPEDLGILPPKLERIDNNPVNFESNFKATTPVYPKSVESTSIPPDALGIQPPVNGTPENIRQNFESNFQATTPVYPTIVENTSPDPGYIGILPPKDDRKSTEDVKVNFESTFKATTPNYPQIVESTSAEPGDSGILPPLFDKNDQKRIETGGSKQNIQQNFASNYKATTPVYPQTVESTSAEPNDLGVLPPFHTKLGQIINGNRNSVPSTHYQPPEVEPDFKNPDNQQQQQRIDFSDYNIEQWENLRKKFLIPDYEFPLEAVSRPSYDSVLSSFQVNPMPE